jgi:nucleotide-binding universal stress UspA family protein
MKTILLPTDFSQTAQHAADFALSLTLLLEAKLVILNVIQPIADAYNIPMSSSHFYQYVEENAETSMDRFKEQMISRHKMSLEPYPIIETKVVYGNISSTILDVAKDYKVDFIVMGMVGDRTIIDDIFGSNALKVSKKAECPVWIIPQKTKIHQINKVVYVTDLEGDEVTFIKKTVDIIKVMGATLKAVHIHEDFEPEIFSSHEIIEHIKGALGESSVKFENLQRADVIEGIQKYLENQRPDALVIAHQDKSWLERLLYKSVITELTLKSKIPVLILQK